MCSQQAPGDIYFAGDLSTLGVESLCSPGHLDHLGLREKQPRKTGAEFRCFLVNSSPLGLEISLEGRKVISVDRASWCRSRSGLLVGRKVG